jgi:phage recombination protein Bet
MPSVEKKNELTVYQPRLPMPKLENYEIAPGKKLDAGMWRVLVEATYPNARTPEAVMMALDYCKARGLDPFKKPVHIVPMWNSQLRREVETVWPGINEIQTTAARTGQWAGMDAPQWGPDMPRKFKGRNKVDGEWVDEEVELTIPEWCSVTVYRMIGNHRCSFEEPVFWLEAYARKGRSELPNEMWRKRTRGQLHKVAKAAALRAAFPEEGEYTAEEMYGKEIGEVEGVVIDHIPVRDTVEEEPLGAKSQADLPKTDKVDEKTGEVTEVIEPKEIPLNENPVPQDYILFGQAIIKAVQDSKTTEEADAWLTLNKKNLERMRDDKNMLKDVHVDGKKESQNVTYGRLKKAVESAYSKLPEVEEADGELLEALKSKKDDMKEGAK